jgi:hypothetical protein
MRSGTAVVVFATTPEDAAGLDTSVGPCAPRRGPRGGVRRPIASPLLQDQPDTLEDVCALYRVLTSMPSQGAFVEVSRAGQARLVRLTDEFCDALRTVVEQRAWRSVGERWLQTGSWPEVMQVGGLSGRVVSWGSKARDAARKGLAVYAWEGPALPVYTLAHGVGRDSYAAYRNGQGKRR